MSETVVDTEGPAGGGDDVLRLTRGASLGRYVILEILGSGGMGVVYAAYDPDLDRKVAIKVLRTRKASHHLRLMREAQALAKLSHPNVVAIHDVGVLDDQVFVAMDFIQGQHLRAWVKKHSPPWKEVVDVFRQAAAGLSAAHAAGLVHRDFKPENVMVDDAGRVRVLDFGLARASGDTDVHAVLGAEDARLVQTADTRSHDVLSAELTRDGAVVGTPAYMAPEQHLGAETSAATDQFSFCLALYESLYGRSPFRGDTLASRAMAVTQGQIQPPPRGSSVPRYLWAVVERGLHPNPDRRHPSMEALSQELLRDPARNRRRALLGLGFAAALAGAFAVGSAGQEEACVSGDEPLAGVWNADARASLRTSFEAAESTLAGGTLERVEAAVDAWTARWMETQRETCEATHVRREQSLELFDLRMACLGDQRQELQALLRVLGEADAEVVENAIQAAKSLPAPERCSNVRTLRGQAERPTDPALLERVEAAEASLRDARALYHAGKYPQSLAVVEQIADEARTIPYPPLQAKVLHEHGTILESNGDARAAESTLRDAARAAELGGDLPTLADTRTLLAMVVGDRLGRHSEGRLWLDLAETSIESLGGDAARSARVANNRALILSREGKYEEEATELQRALELFEQAPEAGALARASVHNNLANILAQLGRHAPATAHAQDALRLYRSELGPTHPMVAIAMATMAATHDYRGEYAEAMKLHEKALALMEAAVGTDNSRVAEIANNLAIAAINLGDLERGEREFRRALEIKEANLGPDNVEVASALSNLAAILRMQGQGEQAIEHEARALAIREKALPPDHPELAGSLAGYASSLEKLERFSEALPLRERAIEIMDRAHGTRSPNIVVDLGNLAYSYVWNDRPAEAIAPASRAVEIVEASETKPDVTAYARIALARALLSNRRDRSRARALVDLALKDIEGLPAETERALIAELAAEAHWKL